MSNGIEEYVDKALHHDVELSRKEYMAKCAKADAVAKEQGIEGDAPLTEAERHARIRTNFYGTVLNFLASIMCEVSETNRMLAELLKEKNDGR